MRHLFIPLLILSMAFSFTACGTSPAASKPQTAPAATGTQTRTEAEHEEDPEITVKAAEPSESPKTNILVVYFSCTGTTQELAGYAAEYLNADSFKIEALVPYTDEDIAYYTESAGRRYLLSRRSIPVRIWQIRRRPFRDAWTVWTSGTWI